MAEAKKKAVVVVDKKAALDAAIERAKNAAKKADQEQVMPPPKAKAPKAEKVKAEKPPIDPLKWDGVTLVKGQPYYLVRQRERDDFKSWLAAPMEVVTAKFLKVGKEEYAFDDGRLAEELVFLCVSFDDREGEVFAHTPEGKKAAQSALVASVEANARLSKLAKGGSEEDLATLSVYELGVCAEVLGKTPEDLVKVGKAKDRKIAFLIKARG